MGLTSHAHNSIFSLLELQSPSKKVDKQNEAVEDSLRLHLPWFGFVSM